MVAVDQREVAARMAVVDQMEVVARMVVVDQMVAGRKAVGAVLDIAALGIPCPQMEGLDQIVDHLDILDHLEGGRLDTRDHLEGDHLGIRGHLDIPVHLDRILLEGLADMDLDTDLDHLDLVHKPDSSWAAMFARSHLYSLGDQSSLDLVEGNCPLGLEPRLTVGSDIRNLESLDGKLEILFETAGHS
jgi:hypothetical protein